MASPTACLRSYTSLSDGSARQNERTLRSSQHDLLKGQQHLAEGPALHQVTLRLCRLLQWKRAGDKRLDAAFRPEIEDGTESLLAYLGRRGDGAMAYNVRLLGQEVAGNIESRLRACRITYQHDYASHLDRCHHLSKNMPTQAVYRQVNALIVGQACHTITQPLLRQIDHILVAKFAGLFRFFGRPS